MNKDQIKGSLKQAAGKVQEKAGELIGNPQQEAKGIGKQVAGKAQQVYGDLKEAAQDLAKASKR